MVGGVGAERRVSEGGVGLYAMLPPPKLDGVWHIKEESGGVLILRKWRAMVLQ